MLQEIEQLLILQDRDRKIRTLRLELKMAPTERTDIEQRLASNATQLENVKMTAKTLEVEKKKLEVDAQVKRDQIGKFRGQQFQTRKNEEYRALAHEIDTCKAAIFKIEDEEIALMEQGETAQKEVVRATHAASEAKKLVDDQVAQLATREENLKKELAELEANREEIAGAVDETVRDRYERLVKHKGENVVVGIQHGVCGGCHMKVPPQLLVSCRQQQELVTCSNCGRILYYSRDMDLAVAE